MAVWVFAVEVVAIAATGATAIRAPRPIATYFLIIAIPFGVSRSTLVCRTSALCASHAELKMNVGFSDRSFRAGAEYCRMRRFCGPRPVPRRSRTDETPPPHFCELRNGCGEHHAASGHFIMTR